MTRGREEFGLQAIVDLEQKLETEGDDLVLCVFVLISPRSNETSIEQALYDMSEIAGTRITMITYRPSRWSRKIHTSIMLDGRVTEHLTFFKNLCLGMAGR